MECAILTQICVYIFSRDARKSDERQLVFFSSSLQFFFFFLCSIPRTSRLNVEIVKTAIHSVWLSTFFYLCVFSTNANKSLGCLDSTKEKRATKINRISDRFLAKTKGASGRRTFFSNQNNTPAKLINNLRGIDVGDRGKKGIRVTQLNFFPSFSTLLPDFLKNRGIHVDVSLVNNSKKEAIKPYIPEMCS